MTPDPTTPAGAHALARLAEARAAWLTTVTPEGQPQSMPVWFIWTGAEVVVYGDHRARRNRNLAANPHVSFHLPDEGLGNDVVTFEGTATIDPGVPPPGENPAYLSKYGALIDRDFGGPAAFGQTYSMPIRIVLTRSVIFQG